MIIKISVEQDKENDARNAQALATQAAIQRRRRPKRRSTGVVAFDNIDVSITMQFEMTFSIINYYRKDMDSEKDNNTVSSGGGGDCEDVSKTNHQEVSYLFFLLRDLNYLQKALRSSKGAKIIYCIV